MSCFVDSVRIKYLFYFLQLIQLTEGNTNGVNNSRKTSQPAVKTPPSKNIKKMSNGDIASEVLGPDDSDSEWQVSNERH